MTQFSNKKYNLEERTVKLAENIIDLVKTIRITPINKRVVNQLVGSGGSIGANYCEANEAESRKDFAHKISIAKKKIAELNQETHELLLIFSKILKSTRSKRN